MGKPLKKQRKMNFGGKTSYIETDVFANPKADYSGFGYHRTDKDKAQDRRKRRDEERNAQRDLRGEW